MTSAHVVETLETIESGQELKILFSLSFLSGWCTLLSMLQQIEVFSILIVN